MAEQLDNPLDGRGRPQVEHAEDGGIYAEGRRVCIRPLRSGRGVMMGGTIAEAQDEATAAEIARRCSAFGPVLAALKEARDIIRIWHGPSGWEIYDRQSPEMQRINAAIARGEGG